MSDLDALLAEADEYAKDNPFIGELAAAVRADQTVRRGLHAGAIDACKELQARLDARARDLGTFTQKAVDKTKALEAKLASLRERHTTALAAVMEISESLVSEASVASRAGQERRLMALSNRLVTIIRQAVLDEATRETT